MTLIAALPRSRARALAAGLRPAHLAALTVLLVCVPTGDKDVTAAVHVTPADLGSLALVGVVGIGAVRALRAGSGPLLRLRHGLLFGGVLVAVAVATAASQDPHQSLSGFVRLVQVFVVVPLAVLLALREERDRVLVLRAFVAAALVEGAIGAWQFATLTGASYEGVTQRAVGTFGVQDVMAMSVVVSYGLLAAVALALRARAAGRGREALVLGAASGFLVVPLAVSFSRGSWIATGVALVVTLVAADLRLALRGLVFALAAAVVLVGGFGVGGAAVMARVASIGSVSSAPDHSVSDRYDLWTTARRIWQDHPATGVGPKEFLLPRRPRTTAALLRQRHHGRGRGLREGAAAVAPQHVSPPPLRGRPPGPRGFRRPLPRPPRRGLRPVRPEAAAASTAAPNPGFVRSGAAVEARVVSGGVDSGWPGAGRVATAGGGVPGPSGGDGGASAAPVGDAGRGLGSDPGHGRSGAAVEARVVSGGVDSGWPGAGRVATAGGGVPGPSGGDGGASAAPVGDAGRGWVRTRAPPGPWPSRWRVACAGCRGGGWRWGRGLAAVAARGLSVCGHRGDHDRADLVGARARRRERRARGRGEPA
ncbi:O-antigen ligase family protein [Streptacidiphilus monticola]